MLKKPKSTLYTRPLLNLYKEVMSLHRRKLPEQFRSFADDYAREEFKTMRKVKDEPFVKEFMKQWNMYADTIRSQQDTFGARMKKSDFDKLDVYQQEQLRKLKSASLAAAAQAEGMKLGDEIHPLEVLDEIHLKSKSDPL